MTITVPKPANPADPEWLVPLSISGFFRLIAPKESLQGLRNPQAIKIITRKIPA